MTNDDSKYRSFFESSADAMLILENDEFVDCNHATVAMLGYVSQEEVINKRPYELSPKYQPDGRLSLDKAAEMIRIANERGNHRFEWDHLRKDGTIVPVEVSLTAIENRDGVQLHTVWRDISKRKQAEQTLHSSEERYRKLYKETPAMLHSIDAEGRLVSVSNYWLEKLGYERDEVLQRKSSEFLTEESRRYAQEVVLPEFFRTGYCFEVPYQFIKKNGEVLDVLLSATTEKDDAGNIIRSLAVLTDVTERKKAVDALAESEEKFRLLLSSTAEAIYGLDTAGNCTFCNPACLRMLSYENESDLLGKSMHKMIHHHKRDGSIYPERECKIYLALKNGEGICDDDEVLWRADGSSFDAEYCSFPMRRGEDLVGAVVTFQDITERKKAQKALIKAKDFAEEANKVKSEFLAKVSHEIRTPMAVFMSAIEHLLDIDQDPTRRQVLNLADLSSQRLYTLVEEVLDFSKIEDSKMELEEVAFSVRTCLQDAVNMMKVKAMAKEIGLEVDVAPDVPESIQGDEFRLGQVLLNLISNAVKFTEDGGVEVTLKLENDNLVFIVKDTGIGIPEDKLKSVFDAFSQADNSTTRKYGGTGLGLAISKGLVELMGGQIHVESRFGHGSQFIINLPCKADNKTDFDNAVRV